MSDFVKPPLSDFRFVNIETGKDQPTIAFPVNPTNLRELANLVVPLRAMEDQLLAADFMPDALVNNEYVMGSQLGEKELEIAGQLTTAYPLTRETFAAITPNARDNRIPAIAFMAALTANTILRPAIAGKRSRGPSVREQMLDTPHLIAGVRSYRGHLIQYRLIPSSPDNMTKLRVFAAGAIPITGDPEAFRLADVETFAGANERHALGSPQSLGIQVRLRTGSVHILPITQERFDALKSLDLGLSTGGPLPLVGLPVSASQWTAFLANYNGSDYQQKLQILDALAVVHSGIYRTAQTGLLEALVDPSLELATGASDISVHDFFEEFRSNNLPTLQPELEKLEDYHGVYATLKPCGEVLERLDGDERRLEVAKLARMLGRYERYMPLTVEWSLRHCAAEWNQITPFMTQEDFGNFAPIGESSESLMPFLRGEGLGQEP